MSVYFIETAAFTRRIVALRLEDELKDLQDELTRNPQAGDTEAGTGGLRKVRIRAGTRGKGKRGGARVHYLFLLAPGVIYFVYVYGKDEQSVLTGTQKKQLKVIAEMIKSEWNTRD